MLLGKNQKFIFAKNLNLDKKHPATRLFYFLILIICGLFLGSIASILPGLLEGITIAEMQENPRIIADSSKSSTLRLSLFLNHLFLFLLPSFIYGAIFFGKDFIKGFELNRSPLLLNISLAILFLLVCYPVVNAVHFLNLQIPLPDWMLNTEQDVAAMLRKIIDSPSKIALVMNILLIAIMPAIGEEMVFRGILQKNIARWTKNPHIGIWIAAFLFSAIHFQFQGFLARMILGAVLGYAYYFTRNFWIPVILHFLNNLIPLIAFVVLSEDITDTSNLTLEFNWLSLILSIVGIPVIIYLFNKINGKREFIET